MRAGWKGLKIVEKRRLLPADRSGAAKTPKNRSRRAGGVRAGSGRPFRADASEASHCSVVRAVVVDRVSVKPAMLGCRRQTARRRVPSRACSTGMTMKGNQDGESGRSATAAKDSRRDRLKLALRENLKRRKSQARGRGDAASSENDDASIDTAGGKS
jgi:hypothetical protein